MKKIKGFKVMNPDMTCRNFKYEAGKTYKHEGEIELCGSGFHFCKELKDCYGYYSFDIDNIVCKVEGSGKIEEGNDKVVCSELKIVKVLEIKDILKELNFMTSSNSGSYNSGSDNSGSSNSGSYNRGSYNSGSSNRGSDNRGSYNSGIFNFGSNCVGVLNHTSFIGKKENIACFNRQTKMTYMQFYRKYMSVLKEIKKYDFSNVYKLPNFNQSKWNKIKKYI